MKKLINYNRVVFKVGGWFTKFWMITMPIFIAFLIFGDVTPFNDVSSSLWSERADSWPIIAFYCFFLIAYPFRNYLDVHTLLKRAEYDLKTAHDYKKVLEAYANLKK